MVATGRVMVPLELAKAFRQDFGGNAAAAADYAGLGFRAVRMAENGVLLDHAAHERLLEACRKRLGRRLLAMEGE